MISSLLPGLRDLRVPLAAGFMWLVVLWLLLYQEIPSEEDAVGIANEVYELFGAFGIGGLTAAITFVAFVVGILLVRLTSPLVDVLIFRRVRRTGRVSESTAREAQVLARKTLAAHERELERHLELRNRPLDPTFIPPSAFDHKYVDSGKIVDQMSGEVSLVATRLLANNRELFDRFDRADAEAKFRFNIALPILAMGVLIPIRLGSAWWAYPLFIGASVVVMVLLVVDAVEKTVESNDAIYQAVFIGAVEFPVIQVMERETAVIKARSDDYEAALTEREAPAQARKVADAPVMN